MRRIRRLHKSVYGLTGLTPDVEKPNLLQKPASCHADFLERYFVVGQKKVCPSVEKDGDHFDNWIATPANSYRRAQR